MKNQLLAIAALIALSTGVQAADVAIEGADVAINKSNSDYIRPLATDFLNKYYPGISVERILPLRTYIRGGIAYQDACVLIKLDGTNKGCGMEYVYDTHYQMHYFVDVFEWTQFLKTGNREVLFGDHRGILDFPKD
jgi:hypothetical protein